MLKVAFVEMSGKTDYPIVNSSLFKEKEKVGRVA